MTHQQAGVSAEAVVKLVEKWRNSPSGFVWTDKTLLKCADELESALLESVLLATAPPEQAALPSQGVDGRIYSEKGREAMRINTTDVGKPQAASAGALSADFEAYWEREVGEWAARGIVLSRGTAELFWKLALERAAQVIAQCNREGPYNAIQGASRIRSLASGVEEK